MTGKAELLLPGNDDAVLIEDDLRPAENQFRLEALEPRILLSADPISGEFARVIQEAYDDNGDEDIAAIMQDISEVAEVRTDAQSDSIENDLSFAWPDGWDEAEYNDAEDAASADADEADSDESGDADVVAAPQQITPHSSTGWLDTLNNFYVLEGETPRDVSGESSPTNGATESNEPASSDADNDSDARAPPEIQAVTTTNAIHSSSSTLEQGSLAASIEAENDNFTLSNDALPVHEALDDSMPRGPPATGDNLLIEGNVNSGTQAADLDLTDTTTSDNVDDVLAQAFDYWHAYAAAIGDSVLADAITALETAGVTISTDGLSGRLLAETAIATATITLDGNAAGYGWFVDTTPGNFDEFGNVVTSLDLNATDAAAVGKVDLLTVLTHEMGHLLAVEHGANALMADELATGKRILLGGTLDLSSIVVPAGSTGTATVTMSAQGLVTVDLQITDSLGATADSQPALNAAGIIRVLDDGKLTLVVNGPNQPTAWTLSEVGGQTTVQLDHLGILGLPTLRLESFAQLDVINGGDGNDDFVVDSTFISAGTAINGGVGNDSILFKQGAQISSFDGGSTVITEIDTVVNQLGALSAPLFSDVENFIDNPLLFVHGFGGSLGKNTLPAGQEEWLTQVGLSPEKLILEPLQNSYDDILSTLQNVGYELVDAGVALAGTLVNAVWDWRVPVAETDLNENGTLENATWSSISSSLDATSPTFDTALDYLVYWMDKALTAWENLTGSVIDAVDLITHSTGGLVAKSYLQSAAYANRDDATFITSNPDAVLPDVNALIQVGVPNQGSGSVFNLLNNNFSQKQATRVLQFSLKQAWARYQIDSTSIHGPDGNPLLAAGASAAEFIDAYVGTLENLLAAYPFIDLSDVNPGLTSLQTSADNKLLRDLNSGGDFDAFTVGTASTHIVYGSGVDTADTAVAHDGISLDAGTANEILSIDDFVVGSLPDASQRWYELADVDGDGTVAALSSSGGFTASTVVTLDPRPGVEHTDLVNDTESQRVIVARLLGIAAASVPVDIIVDEDPPPTLETAFRLIDYGILPDGTINIAGMEFALAKDGIAKLIAAFDDEDNSFTFTETAVVQVDEFLIMSGLFTFEIDFDKLFVDVNTGLPGDLTDLFGLTGIANLGVISDVPMTMWKITAEDVSAFVGINGWQDLDGDGKASFTLSDGTVIGDADKDGYADVTVDPDSGESYGDLNSNGLVELGETAEFATDRVGLQISDLDVAIALMKIGLVDKLSQPWLKFVPSLKAIKATASNVSLVGLESLVGLSIDDIVVEINSGGKWRDGFDIRPAVDFGASFLSELLYFDNSVTNVTGNNNNVIDVPVSGGSTASDFATGSALEVAFIAADSNGDSNGIVTYQELVDEYDTDGDGFVDTTELPDVAAADAAGNDDDILDDAGVRFPLASGSAALTIDYDGNIRLGASTKQAVLSVSQFVQVVGGLSFEKGPRENVNIATSIPANVGDLAALVFDGLGSLANAALEGLLSAVIPNDLAIDDSRLAGIGITPAIWSDIEAYFLQQTGTSLDDALGSLPTSTEVSAAIKGAIQDFLDDFRDNQVWISSDLKTIHNVEVETLQVGMSNVLAFAGIGGPYWTDLDSDSSINWVIDTSDLTDRVLDADSEPVVIDLVPYNPGDELPSGEIITLDKDQLVSVGGVRYGDWDADDNVDAGETGEFNADSIGLALDGANVGFVSMTPTVASFLTPEMKKLVPKLFALQGSANFAGLIGLTDIASAQAEDIRIEVNSGGDWVKNLKFGPIVDFAGSFPGELAELDANADGGIDNTEVTLAGPGTFTAIDEVLVGTGNGDGKLSYEELLAYYDDPTESPTPTLASVGNGVLDVGEVDAAFRGADLDGDDKIDPAGYEIRTGTGTLPIYITSGPGKILKGTTGPVALRVATGSIEIVADGLSVQKDVTETVDIATGIPSIVGTVAQTFIDALVGGLVSDVNNISDITSATIAKLQAEGLLPDDVNLPSPGPVLDALYRSALEEWKSRGLLWIDSDLSTIHNVEVSTLQVGFSNANIFAGRNPINWEDSDNNKLPAIDELSTPPFWTDLDGSGDISFSLPDGTKLLDGSDDDGFVDVTAPDSDGNTWGDKNQNGIVDIGESAELDSNLLGVIVADANFGFVYMQPTLANIPGLDKFIPKLFGAGGSADTAWLVGLDAAEVQLSMEEIELFLNFGTPWIKKLPLFGVPVVNFQDSFPGELLALDYNGNGSVDRVLDGLISLQAADGNNDDELTYAELLNFYDANNGGDDDGVLELTDNTAIAELWKIDTDFDSEVSEAELLAAFDSDNDDTLELLTDSLEGLDWTGITDNVMTYDRLLEIYDSEDAGLGDGILEIVDDILPAVLAGIDADDDGKIDPLGYEIYTGTDTPSIYLDYDGNLLIGGRIGKATGAISDFVHISGSLEFALTARQSFELADGALIPDFSDSGLLPPGLPEFGGTQEFDVITIGGTVNAFIGINGPGFTDGANGMADGVITADELNADAVGILAQNFEFALALMKSSNPLSSSVYFALKAQAEQLSLVGMPGVTLSADHLLIEVNQSTPSAFGVPLKPVVDFASTFPSEFAALDRDNDGVIERNDDSLLVFAAADTGPSGNDDGILTYDELLAEYDTATSPGSLDLSELPATSTSGDLALGLKQFDANDNNILEMSELLAAYDTNSDNQLSIADDGLNGIATGAEGGNGAFEYKELLAEYQGSGSVLRLAEATIGTIPSVLFYADKDEDGLLDPAGLEVGTGGLTDPLYLDMDTFLVRAQGQVELNFLNALTLAGSVAFELGPVETLTLANDAVIEANTLSIGAANVSAFLGYTPDGVYWDDKNNNNEVDTNQADPADNELDENAIGVAITDLDIGLVLFASLPGTDVLNTGVYLAGSADVPAGGIGLQGVPGVTAEGSFAIDINLGLGVNGLSPVKFRTSFPGDMGRLNTDLTPDIQRGEYAELDSIFTDIDKTGAVNTAGDSIGDGNITYEELLAYYDNLSGLGDGDGQLEFVEDSLPAFFASADADGDELFDGPGYQVNTGNTDAPVVLDFEGGLVNFELAGKLEIANPLSPTATLARATGGFLFNVSEVTIPATGATTTQLSVLAVGQLAFGPDVSSGNNFFNNEIVGALVLNGTGIAADIQARTSIGADLGIVDLGGASIESRIVFNTTGVAQRIAIPESFESFLDRDHYAAPSIVKDGATGDLYYVIQPNAPPKADGTTFADGAYFVVEFNAQFDIANTILFDGDFRVTVTTSQFDLSTGAELKFMFLGTEAFRMQGNFDLLISTTQFRVAADASMSVGLLGSLDADGEFIIDSDGVRARLGVTGALGSTGIGLTLGSVSGAVELNTTSADWLTAAGTTVKAESLTIAGGAGIDFVGLASGSGTFLVAFDGTSFQLALDGNLSAGGGLSFRIDAFVGVFSNGVVVSAGVSLNVGNASSGYIAGTLAGRLQINTTPNTVTSYTGVVIGSGGEVIITPNKSFVNADGAAISGIAGKSFLLDIKGSLKILSVLDVDGRVVVDIDSTGWTISGTLSLGIDIFGLASAGVTVDLALNSEGEFLVSLDGYLQLGPDDFNLNGQVVLNIEYADNNGTTRGGNGSYDLDAFGAIRVGATVFGISLGTIDLNFEYSSGKILVKIGKIIPVPFINSTVVDLGWFGSVRIYYPDIKWKDYTFTVGTIDLTPVPEPELGTVSASGDVLNLHVGPLATSRAPLSQDEEEVVLIDQRGGRIYVTMFGFEDSFDASGITKINIADMGLGDDYLKTTSNVTADIEVHFGGGNDILVHEGSGRVKAFGDDGDDRLTGGDNVDMLDGGPGQDVLRGRGGADVIKGGDGDYEDAIFWAVGDGADSTVDGGLGDDRLTIEAANGSTLDATISAAGSGFTATILGNGTLNATAIEAVTVLGSSAADRFTINDLRSSLLDQVSLDLGTGTATDTVIVNGSGSREVIDLSSETSILATAVTGGTAEAPTTVLVETPVDVVSIAIDGSVGIDISGVGGSFGSDTLAINTLGGQDEINVESVRAGLATTIDSGTESDEITVSSETFSLNGIDSKLTIIGDLPTSGSDYLYIDDSGDSAADVYTLTSDNLSSNDLAPGGIDYSGIEHLIVTLGTGNDIFNVKSIVAETTINGNNGSDTVNVGSAAAGTVANPNTNSGGDLAGIAALLTVNGDATSSDVLNVDDTGNTATTVASTLTSSALTGLSFATGGSIDYGSTENLNINLGAGADTFNVQSTSALTTVRTGAGVNIVNVGSATPGVGGTVDAINRRLIIYGESGDDTINVDETGESDNEVATLTDSLLTGLGIAANDSEGIEYFGVEEMNINLGTGTDDFTVRSTSALTTVNTGTGADPNTVNVGFQVSASNNSLNGMGGKLVVNGQSSGTETLNVSDSGDGDNAQNVGTMTFDRITGLGMAANDSGKGIEYNGFNDLNIDLGTGNDTFTIESTHAGTTDLTAGNGADVINVRTIDGITTVAGGTGSDHINVGSSAAGTQGDPTNNSDGTLNDINAALTIDGNDPDTGSDSLLIDDTGDDLPNTGVLTDTTLTGLDLAPAGITYGTIEHLTIRLGDGGNTFTVDGTHGATTAGTQETTTLETGGLNDFITINDVTDTLTVNGQGGNDDVNVNGTGLNSTSNLNGDANDDRFHIRDIDGRVFVNGGDDADSVYVTDIAVMLPGAAPDLPDTGQRTIATGSVDSIDALLDVTGGEGSDQMFVDGSAAPPIPARDATLTESTLDGMGLSSEGIDYRGLEALTIWMDVGNNTMTVDNTHDGTTSIYMSDGTDTVDVNDASGIVNIYGEQAADIFNIRATADDSVLNLRGHEGTDTFNISSESPTRPHGDYPVGAGPPGTDDYAGTPLDAEEIGIIDAIDGLVDIEGGSDADKLNIDDSANPNSKRGTLTSDTLRGMDMPDGVNYREVEDLNLWLGTKSDTLYIASTHAGTTQVYGGDGITGIADDNFGTPERDDTIAINTIAGVTTVYGQGGNDLILVNVTVTVNAVGEPDGAFTRTNANGIADADLNLTGNGGSDEYVINLSGVGTALINVHDYGSPDDGVDRLTINGADGTATEDDTFLLRKDFVALLNMSDGSAIFDKVERVNYDQNINERLVVNGLGGADRFVADDNSATTTLDGGDGEDSFQIGQIFATLRTAEAAAFNQIAPGDEFDTTRVIIGIIRNPTTGAVIFDPSTDQLTASKIIEIESHIDPLTGYLAGIAYVSDGVSQPTTVYGGDDDDTFSVYQNKGTLRLEGEANNDSFVVRAFVLLPTVTNVGTGELEELEEQAETEVRGGDDDDTIQYAINAPVSIDGGAGFDTVVVLGTPFPDAFVVNAQGIFGAGLNVTFENVESAELDALEGDDTIYVLGTNKDLVTLIIGGQGSDTISVMGDVVSDIVSNDLLGRAGLITHRFTAGSGAFANVGVNGVDSTVVGADSGSLVDISAAGVRSTLAEDDGSILEYFIQLTNPATGQTSLSSSVFLTVSAGLVSAKDQESDGESVLVSLDNMTWSKSVVLTFDETGTPQSVYVKAVNDDSPEGPRLALISHTINSMDIAYDDLAIADVLVDIVDDDKAGIDIRQFEEIGGLEVVDAITEVLEGSGGFSDIYRIALTRAPNAGETVTVTLSASDRLSYFDMDGNPITSLTFNAGDWFTAQLVRVVANENNVTDGTSFVTITHEITSSGGLYSGILEDAFPTLDVKVFDDESAGAIIRQSDGRTIVVANDVDTYVADDDDSYRVRLTQEIPGSDVVGLQLFTDRQTELVTGGRLVFIGEDTVQGTFEYLLTFNASNWDDWYEVQVVANEDFEADGGQPLKTFTPQDQNLDQIAGPLIIEGGVIEGRDRTFATALLLPGEQDQSVLQDNNTDQSGDIDRLDIFHTDNTAAESGALVTQVNPLDDTDPNAWVLLTGFETDRISPTLTVNEGTEDVPVWADYDRGISFNGFEILEVLLGKGNEELDVNATPDNAITVIHGGGGDDTINIFDRGNGPLVVYGDTSQDRTRYDDDSGFASRDGTPFTNDGNDTINAFGMAPQGEDYVGLVIYGGFGDDTIDGSQDDDHIAGGTGNDTIRGHGGNDHIYGDSHFDVDPDLFAQDQVTRFANNADEVGEMFQVPVSTPGDEVLNPTDGFIEGAGEDHIEGGDGADIIFGDHGIIDLLQGTRRIETTGDVQFVSTTLPAIGAADTIYGDDGGDLIFGGQGGDTIDAGEGDNVVFGDHGEVDYGSDLGDIESLTSLVTTAEGGADDITTGNGDDIIIGGRLDDTIVSTGGNNIVLGDSGEVIASVDSDDARRGSLPVTQITVSVIRTIEPDDGGIDVITTGAGADIVLGGKFGDTIESGGGADIVLGDHGEIAYELAQGDGTPATIDRIMSTDLTIGGMDIIFGEDGDDILIGGLADDLLDGGADSDLIFGDAVTLLDRDNDITSDRFQVLQGQILYSRAELPAFLQGTATAPFGNDSGQVLVDGIARSYRNPDGGVPAWAEYTIADLHHSDVIETMGAADGGFGDDYIAGGAGHDMIFGQLGDDVIQGDGSIDSAIAATPDPVGATRFDTGTTMLVTPEHDPVPVFTLQVSASDDASTDGDDYIEGNGGSDVIFGNLGQDDIVGGSSDMFSLITPDLRPDVDDILFGGSGTEIDHNELFDNEADDLDTIIPAADVHARDADVIAGDNANIYRIVGTGSSGTDDFLRFDYDEARGGSELIRVRAVELLDYTEGGSDFDAASAASDIGAADEIHGESGDDFIYGMVGNDLLFGDSESDDIIGGYGADWISGGQGMDGVIGDDGRIYTGRYVVTSQDPNQATGYAELLNGVLGVDQLDKLISTPGNIQQAIINPSENGAGTLGEIFKTVDITPYNLDPSSLQDRDFAPLDANDIIFGGLGNDFLHGAAGDDAMSGAEALPEYFNAPFNPGNVLRFNADRIEFADYDEEFPRRALDNFVLNFDPSGDPNPVETANDNFDEDVLFGDLGNDWLVGGPDNDQLFGGFGADLMDADDDKGTNGGENDMPDTVNIDIQDRAYGGGGRDVLIANSGGDRLMDWVGEFNSFIVPFAPFGNFTVSRAPTPHTFTFLYELSESLGADQSRRADTDGFSDPERNGEPDGELGLVTQKDSGLWQDQSGAPIDPQPGNIPGGPRLTLRGVDFNSGTTETFAVDQGQFQAVQGRLEVSSTNLGETATAVFHVGEYLPHYYEITATISTGKPTGGLKANSYLIFDYVSPTDFKYAGINISTDKLEMGYVDETGWHELVQVNAKLRHSTDYDVLLSINGLTATLIVDNKDILAFTYDARVDSDGFSYGLNYGLVGLGGISSVARIDNMIVQKLSPEITFEATETFDSGPAGFTTWNGDWQIASGAYRGTSVLPDAEAVSLFDLNVDPNSYLELEVTVDADTLGGLVFDHYDDGTYKFAGVLADTDQVVIGHVGKAGTIVYDAVADIASSLVTNNGEYTLRVSLKGSTVSVAILGGKGANQTWYEVVGHAFNAVTVDGKAGVLSVSGESTIDDFAIRTDDPAFISEGDALVTPSLSLETDVPTLEAAAIEPLLDEAIRRMTAMFALDSEQQATLAAVQVTIADLPGLVLARNNGTQIDVDTDAAGHGWFVDTTPSDDSEFDANGGALFGSGADGDIDLLTAMMHELGHVLGFEHGDSTIMTNSITTGERIAGITAQDTDLSDGKYQPERHGGGSLMKLVTPHWTESLHAAGDGKSANTVDVRGAETVMQKRLLKRWYPSKAYLE